MEEFETNIVDQKEEIKRCIRDGIKNEFNLAKIKKLILNKSKKLSLDSIEENYIHHKYIKYCLKQWFEQLPILFTNMTPNGLQDFKDKILKIKTLEDLSVLFSNTKSFKPIIENAHLLIKADRDLILVEFKQNFIDYLKEKSVDVRHQYELFLEIKKLLTEFFSIYDIHKYTKGNRIRSDELINRIQEVNFLSQLIDRNQIPNERWDYIFGKYEKLKHALRPLQTSSETNLTDSYWVQITKMFIYSLTPVTFGIERKETQNILLAKGVYISLSRVLTELEKQLTQSKSVELCLSALETLFIDCDLENQTWHGNNIAIRAKRIIIIGKRTIDVSGLDGDPQEKPSKAANGRKDSGEEGKNGQHGLDGTKGESGGNVIIITDILENAQNWTIKSNGGNGSYGQDGGDGANGEDGADGHGLTLEEFKRDFPAAAKLKGASSGRLATDTYNRIKRISREIQKDKTWYINGKWVPCFYIEGTTSEGNKIYFSFYYSWIHTKQAYCLYKGTSGQPGKPGGFGSLGGYAGEPGFAGDVQTIQKSNDKTKIKIVAVDGSRKSDGNPGKDGNYGKSGENKPDVGYIDCDYWQEPVYMGPDWYKLMIYKSSTPTRIIDAEDNSGTQYIEFERRSPPDPPACLSINENARQKHKHAKKKKEETTRKHAVSNELLTETFNEYQSEMSITSIENLQISVDFFRKELSRLHIEEENIEKENISITKAFIQEKHLKLTKTPLQFQSNKFIPSDSFSKIKQLLDNFQKSHDDKNKRTVDYIVKISNELKCDTYSYENTLNILSLFENSQSIWEKLKLRLKKLNEDDYNNLDTLIIEKVKLSLLEKIAQIIDNNIKNIKNEFIEEETYSGTNSAIHSTLGVKNEFSIYEYPDCDSVRRNLKDNLLKIVNDNPEISKSLHQSIIKFFSINENQNKFPCMKRYVENFFDQKNPQSDKNLLTEYGNYISSNEQSFNKHDVVLLAYLHNICLNVYVFSDDDISLFKLFSTYNEKSNNVQHVLYLNDQFIKLSVKKIEDKNARYLRYNQILNDVQQLKTSDEFRNYFDNKHYESSKNQRKINDQIEETTIDEVIRLFDMNIGRTS